MRNSQAPLDWKDIERKTSREMEVSLNIVSFIVLTNLEK